MQTKVLVSATVLALAMNASAAETQLTIYSGDFDAVAASPPGQGMSGFALVSESRAFELSAGDNTLTHSSLPAAIDAAGVRFAPTSSTVEVLGQSFNFAIADQSELLRRALGQRVTVEQAVGAERQSWTGTLLAAGDGLTLALDGGAVRVLSSYTSFELGDLPGGLFVKPTLVWKVQSPRAGSETFALHYPTGGLAWRAEYLARVSGSGPDCRMDFSGAAQVLNRSGASFEDAELTLVAGEPNLQRAPPPQRMQAKSARLEMTMAAPSEQPSGEYHAYRLPGRAVLPDGSVQRVTLLRDASGVSCVRRYESRSPMGYHKPATPIVHPDYGPVGTQPVMAMLEFGNRKEAGLGIALPAGRLRVFVRDDSDGSPSTEEAFLGEAMLEHTAAGREVRAALGEAFDLGVERTREEFQLDPDGRGMQERISLKVHNAKPNAATVRVIESLPRWSEWEVVETSMKWTRLDAQNIAFEVPIPAAGEATVRYRVRYRWPESVKP